MFLARTSAATRCASRLLGESSRSISLVVTTANKLYASASRRRPTPGSEACKPLKDAFLQCAPACEALHFKRTCCPPTDCSPAKDCTPSPAVPDGDPAVQPGAPMSCNRACSELAVYECMLQCAQSAMSAQRTNVPPDCAAKWQALIQGLESDIASLRWACYMCDHKPGDFPFDPNGPAYASVGVGNRASQ